MISEGVWRGCLMPHVNQDQGLVLRGGPHYLSGKSEPGPVSPVSHDQLPTQLRVRYIIRVK